MIRFNSLTRGNSFVALLSIAALSLMILAPTVAQAQSLPLYIVDAFDNQLRTVDPVTGFTLTSIAITITGDAVNGANGLAIHPITGDLFALLKLASLGTPGVPDPRELVTIDPATGVATSVGNTGEAFAGIAFAPDGTLYGVTGDGANTPSTLFTISTADGTATVVQPLGNGNDGETIAFNPNDGLIYHLSGIGVRNDSVSGEIFESIDPATGTVTNIPLSVDDYREAIGFAHWSGDWFLVSDLDTQLYLLNTSGQVRLLSFSGLFSKGLAFAGAAPSCSPLSDLFGAAHQGQDGPSVFYAIDPTDGTPTMVGPIGLERVGAMAFDGAGTLYGIGEPMDGLDRTVLATIDPCTGAATIVGDTSIPGFGVSDMSFRNSDGLLSAMVVDGDDLFFAVVNPGTGEAVPVGLTSDVREPGNALAYSHGDVLMHSDMTPVLNSIDPADGAATLITDLTFSAPADNLPRFNAMDFEPATGTLFGSLNDGFGGAPENHLATINTGSGTVTILGQTQDGLDALAFRSKANLSVVKFADVASLDFGSDIKYVIIVTNDGPEVAGGVSFTDTVDSSLTIVSAIADGGGTGSCSTLGQVVTCGFGPLAVGTFDAAAIVATTSAEGVVANTADVVDDDLDEATPSDNSSTANVTVTTYTVGASPGTTVIKTNTSGTVTVTVTPDGTAFPNAVALSCGSVPAGVTCSFNPASVDASGGAATSTLTITHAKKIGTGIPFTPVFNPTSFDLFLLGLLGLMSLSLLVYTRRSANVRVRQFAPATLVLIGVLALAACGGAKRVSYNVTISATSGTITQTASVSVATK